MTQALATNVLALLALILILPLYRSWQNWRQHQVRYEAALARGWRCAPVSWRAILRPRFVMAGHTPSGVVWEMRRITIEGQHYLEWWTAAGGLPYGRLVILPRAGRSLPVARGLVVVHARPQGDQPWEQQFALLVSHDTLAERYFDDDLGARLLAFPDWPAAGALVAVDWQTSGLRLRCRFHDNWSTLDRLVALGVALADRVRLAA